MITQDFLKTNGFKVLESYFGYIARHIGNQMMDDANKQFLLLSHTQRIEFCQWVSKQDLFESLKCKAYKMLIDTYPLKPDTKARKAFKLINNIDWKLFRNQRIDLQKAIDLNKSAIETAKHVKMNDMANRYKKENESLRGIEALCDEIVDFAIDVLGKDEKDILITEDK
jgi:hypothetical protein